VDFLGERIWMRFGWTYNAEMEIFCSIQMEIADNRANPPAVDNPTDVVIEVVVESSSMPEQIAAETAQSIDMATSNLLEAGEIVLAQPAHTPGVVVPKCVPNTKLIQTPESLPVSGMYFFCQYQDFNLDL